LGLHVDWRRSFITTDVNPYYDSFIRWQFNTLRNHAKPKVKFGERYTIYSPLDGQACMDHDRASGEGVGVQEYTCIKLEVELTELASTPLDQRDAVKDGVPVGKALTAPELYSALKGKSVYMVAATLRPETMYGQTNCFVGVDLEYGIYEVSPSMAYICTERAAKNMTFQGLFAVKGEIVKLGAVKGWDLVGLSVKAPLSPYPRVYVLPMEGVLATKVNGFALLSCCFFISLSVYITRCDDSHLRPVPKQVMLDKKDIAFLFLSVLNDIFFHFTSFFFTKKTKRKSSNDSMYIYREQV
jgi:leucyl-tRNA synthetase